MKRQAIQWLAVVSVLLAGCSGTLPTGLPVIPGLPTGLPTSGGGWLPGPTPPTTGAPLPPPGGDGEAAVRPIVARHAAKQGLPVGLVLAVIAQESSFKATAVSPTGAKGLMQLMPGTITHINGAGGASVLDPFDPEQNVAGGCWYLHWVRQQIPAAKVVAGEEWKFALGAYNGGIGRVTGAIDKALTGAPRSPRVAWDDIASAMPLESRRYVPAVLTRWDHYGH